VVVAVALSLVVLKSHPENGPVVPVCPHPATLTRLPVRPLPGVDAVIRRWPVLPAATLITTATVYAQTSIAW
jgi:hypothetical protein